ncbi:MAG: asparagine synthase (glutamine-hydrolyzing), partial [Candidatus Omnitrophica bacterium]|nr:asparagine synthase (glutamine-hydrolyzing) [Candidatus Omnitrophota bacterium]
MCGIAGIYQSKGLSEDHGIRIKTMTDSLRHRGPDDCGFFYDEYLALGHTRLSILDLSENGRQPMVSKDGRYIISFNGEIYNYQELKEDLIVKGYTFRSQTDTEVLLSMFMEHGPSCLKLLNGMFAFVVYDQVQKTLFIARDRFGMKPLFYTSTTHDEWMFSSEIKALRKVMRGPLKVNEKAVLNYFIFNRTCVDNQTFFEDIHLFPKGHYATIQDGKMVLRRWWQLEDCINQYEENEEDAVVHLEGLLKSALRIHLRCDVRYGLSLSGGMDSSILLGLFDESHAQRKDVLKTFTMLQEDPSINEGVMVEALAGRFAFERHDVLISAEDLERSLEQFILTHEQPMLNPSYVAQFLLMRKVKSENVKVLLTGQGGDEVFAGYPYLYAYYL